MTLPLAPPLREIRTRLRQAQPGAYVLSSPSYKSFEKLSIVKSPLRQAQRPITVAELVEA